MSAVGSKLLCNKCQEVYCTSNFAQTCLGPLLLEIEHSTLIYFWQLDTLGQ